MPRTSRPDGTLSSLPSRTSSRSWRTDMADGGPNQESLFLMRWGNDLQSMQAVYAKNCRDALEQLLPTMSCGELRRGTRIDVHYVGPGNPFLVRYENPNAALEEVGQAVVMDISNVHLPNPFPES